MIHDWHEKPPKPPGVPQVPLFGKPRKGWKAVGVELDGTAAVLVTLEKDVRVRRVVRVPVEKLIEAWSP